MTLAIYSSHCPSHFSSLLKTLLGFPTFTHVRPLSLLDNFILEKATNEKKKLNPCVNISSVEYNKGSLF